MISVNLAYNGYVGLSTDTKPIEDVNNGSRFYEMDTQKSYMFNAEGAEWIEQTAEGGGGGTGGDTLVITISEGAFDKTYEEVLGAIEDGTPIILQQPNLTDGITGFWQLSGCRKDDNDDYHFLVITNGEFTPGETPLLGIHDFCTNLAEGQEYPTDPDD